MSDENKPKFAVGGVIPKSEWKAGDEAICIPLERGYVYMNKAAVEHYGEDFFKKLNGSEATTVVAI